MKTQEQRRDDPASEGAPPAVQNGEELRRSLHTSRRGSLSLVPAPRIRLWSSRPHTGTHRDEAAVSWAGGWGGGCSKAPVTIARAATRDQDSLRKSSVHRAAASTGWQRAGLGTTESHRKIPAGARGRHRRREAANCSLGGRGDRGSQSPARRYGKETERR